LRGLTTERGAAAELLCVNGTRRDWDELRVKLVHGLISQRRIFSPAIIGSIDIYITSTTAPVGMRKTGDDWTLEYDDGVLVARFEASIEFKAFGDEAFPAFKQILDTHGQNIVGSANLVSVGDHLGKEVYDVWEQAATKYASLPNYQRGAFVAEGLKQFSLQKSLDVPGAENQTFDDFDAAIEWVREADP
jgi:hypothetical protein